MSEKRFAGLTIDQLNAAGAAAGADAVAKAHAAGLPSPGMTNIRLANGDELKVVTRHHPDGTLEIADTRIHLQSETRDQLDPSHKSTLLDVLDRATQTHVVFAGAAQPIEGYLERTPETKPHLFGKARVFSKGRVKSKSA